MVHQEEVGGRAAQSVGKRRAVLVLREELQPQWGEGEGEGGKRVRPQREGGGCVSMRDAAEANGVPTPRPPTCQASTVPPIIAIAKSSMSSAPPVIFCSAPPATAQGRTGEAEGCGAVADCLAAIRTHCPPPRSTDSPRHGTG